MTPTNEQSQATSMTSNRSWYIWCLAAYPSVQLYDANFGEAFFIDLLFALAASLILAALLLGAFSVTRLDRDRSALAAAGALLVFFGYGPVIEGHQYLHETVGFSSVLASGCLTLLLGIAGAGAFLFASRAKALAPVTRVLNIFTATILLLAVASIAWQAGVRALDRPDTIQASDGEQGGPDIIVMVLDAYGGSDVLQDFYDFDNAPFADALRTRGFAIVDPFHANYPYTELSLGALTNMDYLLHPGGEPNPQLDDRDRRIESAPDMFRDNLVTRILKDRGYEFITFETGYSFVEIVESDRYIAVRGTLSDFQVTFIGRTLAGPLLEMVNVSIKSTINARDRRLRYHNVFDTLAEIEQASHPRFYWAHLVFPHEPFVFDAQGNAIEPPDRNDLKNYAYRDLYIDQLQYVNASVLQLVDTLHEKLPDSVIVVLGDHGPRYWRRDEVIPRDELARENLSTFLACRIPESYGAPDLHEGITPANVFRKLLNQLFDTEFEVLPDLSFTPTKPGSYNFIPTHWDDTHPVFSGEGDAQSVDSID